MTITKRASLDGAVLQTVFEALRGFPPERYQKNKEGKYREVEMQEAFHNFLLGAVVGYDNVRSVESASSEEPEATEE